jgi:Holliday junction resolvasome RuvABC endonuclease subunit
MNAIGIDYSLTSPAACLYSDTEMPRFWFAHERKSTRVQGVTCACISPGSVVERSAKLASDLLAWIFLYARDIKTVAIEDYAFAATGRVFHIGENTGILKYQLEQHNLRYESIPPTVIKKFATGKGTADKYKMTSAFLDAFDAGRAWIPDFFPRTDDPIPAKSPLSDLADAYWIARYFHDKQKKTCL